jgi:hypothetical protein
MRTAVVLPVVAARAWIIVERPTFAPASCDSVLDGTTGSWGTVSTGTRIAGFVLAYGPWRRNRKDGD